MWKKLIAALAACGLSTTFAIAQPQPDARGENANRPTTLEADGFGDAIFAPARLANLVGQTPTAPARPVDQLNQPVSNALPPGDPIASEQIDAFVWGPSP